MGYAIFLFLVSILTSWVSVFVWYAPLNLMLLILSASCMLSGVIIMIANIPKKEVRRNKLGYPIDEHGRFIKRK